MFCNRVTKCVGNKPDDMSCFNLKELREIARAINETGIFKRISVSAGKASVYKNIKDSLKNICNTETCWLDKEFLNNVKNASVRDKIKFFTYKPMFVSGSNDKCWLSNMDINNVVKQLVYRRKNINYLGALPCDIHRLYKLDFSKMTVSNKTFIVFNTDTHDKNGRHWVTVCIDNVSKTIEYFDSTGGTPNKYTKEFINNIKGYPVTINKIRHQQSDSECGMYAIYYIMLKLKNKSLDQINKTIITDTFLNESRKCVFNMI